MRTPSERRRTEPTRRSPWTMACVRAPNPYARDRPTEPHAVPYRRSAARAQPPPRAGACFARMQPGRALNRAGGPLGRSRGCAPTRPRGRARRAARRTWTPARLRARACVRAYVGGCPRSPRALRHGPRALTPALRRKRRRRASDAAQRNRRAGRDANECEARTNGRGANARRTGGRADLCGRTAATGGPTRPTRARPRTRGRAAPRRAARS